MEVGHVTIEGKRYRYAVEDMNVEFKMLPVARHFIIWNEAGEHIHTVLFEGETAEGKIKKVVDMGKWQD